MAISKYLVQDAIVVNGISSIAKTSTLTSTSALQHWQSETYVASGVSTVNGQVRWEAFKHGRLAVVLQRA